MKAVIPAAGLGTRFLPITRSQPKEMLPVVDKPVIQYVVEEAISAGIDDILIITGPGKRSIEDHFDKSFEVKYKSNKNLENKYLMKLEKSFDMVSIHYIAQNEQKGLGDAVYCARKHIGEKPFALMLGDTINISKIPVIRQLMDVFDKYKKTIIAIEEVPKSKIKDYGIAEGKFISDKILKVSRLVEKPKLGEVSSNLGITGSYILTPAIFDCIKQTKPGKNGEIQLTDALSLLNEEEVTYAYKFEGKRYDIGDKLGWIKTLIELSYQRSEFKNELKEFMEGLIGQ